MTRRKVAFLILVFVSFAALLLAEEPADLTMHLRTATGSNRFQIGEVIPIEVALSSIAPKHYLEPCELFSYRSFGFPQCRFFSKWSFTVTPVDGSTDFLKDYTGPMMSSGPMYEVPNNDLTSQSVKFPYVLTSRFRFGKPGEYHVRLSIEVGLDDESTQPRANSDQMSHPHSGTVTQEIVLQIVPAEAAWLAEVIRKGSEAYSAPSPRVTDPPTPELLQYQMATEQLCTLDTPDATRAFAKLLAQGADVQKCLRRSSSQSLAIEEMRRLLVDPDTAICSEFFSTLTRLLGGHAATESGLFMLSQENIDTERDRLIAALPQKRGEAQIASLGTVLSNPVRSKPSPGRSSYDLPFPHPVIAAVVANYDRLPGQTQRLVIENFWDRVRSPLMLPLVRRKAEAGDGQALLRWLELDPKAAEAFEREEVVRPVPRFSSYYLRLPDPSLPGQEKQIAANFVALTNELDLIRSATLLQRYATRAVLPTVFPFIEAKRAGWPCSIQIPALAYLLKVSPEDAAPRVEQAFKAVNNASCNTNTFLTDIGFLQPRPVLEKLAMAEIDAGQPQASDGADYLRRHGSIAARAFLWNQLKLKHQKLLDSGAEKRFRERTALLEGDNFQYTLLRSLLEAMIEAQSWVFSTDDSNRMRTLLGEPMMSELSCGVACGGVTGIGPEPGQYSISGKVYDWFSSHESPMEFLNRASRGHYQISQYQCDDLSALKEKLLQFPAGSSFGFVDPFTESDRNELVEISDFLWSHGFKVRNFSKWSFLRTDSQPQEP